MERRTPQNEINIGEEREATGQRIVEEVRAEIIQ
jgi:hypothetical protein